MSWKEEFSELLQILDEFTATYPIRLFNVTPEKDSTPVRQVAFALENIIEQLRKPLVPSTQSLAQALVYKFNGPHRRQGFWMIYKNLSRALRRYNEDNLLEKVSDLHKKATATGAGFYMPSLDALRYIGGAFLKRFFRLQQIRDLCIRTTHIIMGQLELGHWEKFSLFIVALCADISSGVRRQAASMESAYNGLARSLHSLDDRFPETLAELTIFSSLRGNVVSQKNTDTSRVMRLLKISDQQLDAARTRDQMAQFRDEILSNVELKEDSVDVGVTIERIYHSVETPVPTPGGIRKALSADSGLQMDLETSMLDASPYDYRQVDDSEETVEVKPAKKRKKKRKNDLTVRSVTDSKLLPCVFDGGGVEIIEENKEANVDRRKRCELDTSSTALISKSKKKKKRKKNILPNNSFTDAYIIDECDESKLMASAESHISSTYSSFEMQTGEETIAKKRTSQKNFIASESNFSKQTGDWRSSFSCLSELPFKSIEKNKRRKPQTTSILHNATDEYDTEKNMSSIKERTCTETSSTKSSRGKRKIKKTSKNTSSTYFDTADNYGISSQISSTKDSLFKTAKVVKRRMVDEAIVIPHKNRHET